MNRAKFADTIAKKMGVKKRLASEFIDAFEEVVIDELSNSGNVKLVGFGTFDIVERKSKLARNIRTGEPVMVPARKVVVFKVGKFLKESIEE
jgi:nucleoid DNA-binding protein